MNRSVAGLSTALADRYRLERELGQGGMATVYLAHDLKHQRQVAIKVLKPELGAVLGAERFLSEIRTTASLQHPHLLPLFDSGEAGGLLYYVMPFVEGETLRTRMLAQPQLPVDETVRLITAVAGALDFAHARGIVHRDLKPENILLQAGQPVIADFGIALAVAQAGNQRITETGLSLGTPHYMSPEQAAGTHTVDARSDQYALGAIAYELLSGEPPHSGPTAQAIIARLMTETPRAIRSTRPAVPAGVEAAILRALEKAPADRFASCGAFANALASGANDSNSAARAVSAPATRRWKMVAGLLTVVAASVVAIALVKPREGARAVATSTDDERSLAVLPFTSVGGDTANSYFAAGIADELTSALSRIPGLRLAGRASAARVKEDRTSTREIGRALDVAAVLDGSVRRAGERIRVSTELTSTSDGRVLWTETYERPLADVFAVQDDITRSIVSALQVRLTNGGSTPGGSSRGGTADLAAYDLYLRALQLYRARGAGLLDAERYLLDAIARDRGYAKAHALLASVLLTQPDYSEIRYRDVGPRALAAAQRAVALDDSLADGHLALGYAHREAFEWDTAVREMRLAIELDPRSADAHYRLGETLVMMGLIRAALEPLEAANTLDPLYAVAGAYRAWVHGMLGELDVALSEIQRTLSRDPGDLTSNTILLVLLDLAGRRSDAVAQAQRFLKITSDPQRLGSAGWVLARSNRRAEAEELRRRLESMPVHVPGRSAGLAYVAMGLGDVNAGLDALEAAVARDPQRVASFALVSFWFDSVRRNPRFAALVRALKLDVERLTLPDGGRSR